MAEVVSIKTQKPPVESITVKFTKGEAQDVIRAYKSYWGEYSPVVKTLEKAVAGETSVLADALRSALVAKPF